MRKLNVVLRKRFTKSSSLALVLENDRLKFPNNTATAVGIDYEGKKTRVGFINDDEDYWLFYLTNDPDGFELKWQKDFNYWYIDHQGLLKMLMVATRRKCVAYEVDRENGEIGGQELWRINLHRTV